MLNTVILKIMLFTCLVVSTFGQAKAQLNPRDEFLKSLQKHRHLLGDLISNDARVRQKTAPFMNHSPSYRQHIQNYLDYLYSTDGSHDIFTDLISNQDIEDSLVQDQKHYRKLLHRLFGRYEIEGADASHFYMRPDLYFKNIAGVKLKINPKLTFEKLFELLKKQLPNNFPYSTKLEILPNIPGGVYDPKRDVISFGDFPPNISTVMGFIHEFGHSVFRFDSDDPETGRYIGGFNEAYAELWASQVAKFPFISEIFSSADKSFIADYIEFRKVFGQRFYWLALKMERMAVISQLSTIKYQTIQRQEGFRVLRVSNMLAILPISAGEPGDLPLYLIAGFVDQSYRNRIGPEIAKDLLKIGEEFAGDLSLAHFRTLLTRIVNSQ